MGSGASRRTSRPFTQEQVEEVHLLLQEVNRSCPRPFRVAVVGQSHVGKSTLIYNLYSLLRASYTFVPVRTGTPDEYILHNRGNAYTHVIRLPSFENSLRFLDTPGFNWMHVSIFQQYVRLVLHGVDDHADLLNLVDCFQNRKEGDPNDIIQYAASREKSVLKPENSPVAAIFCHKKRKFYR